MPFAQQSDPFDAWLDKYMRKGGADVPARLATLLALSERLREEPSLSAGKHVAESGMQLEGHNNYVACALKRFGIVSPVKEFGRRSSNLHGWIGPLFDWLQSTGFDTASESEREEILLAVGSAAAARLQLFNQGKPLIARYNKGTARAVIGDILDQAQEKKRAKDVAEYLVGAKLQLRLGEGAATPKNVNTPNRDQPADFPVGNAAIEVTVSPADSRHLLQVERLLNDTTLQVWLLVRLTDREKWQNVVDAAFEKRAGRVAIADIETFVGQNVSEIGGFEASGVADALADLFQIYNQRWLPEAGASGLRIVDGDPGPK